MAFLPGLSRHLLGEDLKMPSVATWWCGQEAPRKYVIEHLRDLVIKPAFPRFGQHAEFPNSMDDAACQRLIRRIEARPEDFVAQERIALSTAPVRTDIGFLPRHAVLRVYAAWNGMSYSVMPGGLTRVSKDDSSLIVSMQQGGGTKDTWVLGGWQGEPSISRRQLSLILDSQPNKGDMPSRVADNLFWLGRYAERVEGRVRFVRTLLPALSGEEDFGRGITLETAMRMLVQMQYLPEDPSAAASIGEQRWTIQRVLTEMVYDPSQTSSLRRDLKELRRVARNLKERLSTDTWRVLQQLESQFSSFAPSNSDQRYFAEMDLLDGAVTTLSAFSGLLMENTVRGFGWRFLEIGRRLERALEIAELLRCGLSAASSEIEPYLQVLLQIADSSITYRQRYPTALQSELVLAVLLADETNPRSVGFQVASLLHQINRLQEDRGNAAIAGGTEYTLATRAVTIVRQSNMADLARRNAHGQLDALDDLFDRLRKTLWELSDALTARYLIHLTASRLKRSW
jgi:uncharacterized alpha-E superfamily protein